MSAATRQACDEGRPIVTNDHSPSSKAYMAIAREIASACGQPAKGAAAHL
ncbi:hypothetical protein GTO91_05490 [Heliobacterium undosum]|uniref:Uncharacterized protein n=1 Tax=Heliomicrobium undosum TaxID=121734 RepID=A0A845KZH3_9FIRM|nr:Mrp/NBP35 family ATP-binding protein [Heliomicrobium undosum]MZP29163.1 hypothetical protein [Heliomicrobium undosum]